VGRVHLAWTSVTLVAELVDPAEIHVVVPLVPIGSVIVVEDA
jgi:hypothetical protein